MDPSPSFNGYQLMLGCFLCTPPTFLPLVLLLFSGKALLCSVIILKQISDFILSVNILVYVFQRQGLLF